MNRSAGLFLEAAQCAAAVAWSGEVRGALGAQEPEVAAVKVLGHVVPGGGGSLSRSLREKAQEAALA